MTHTQDQIAAIDRVIAKRRKRYATDEDIREMLRMILDRRPRFAVREYVEKRLADNPATVYIYSSSTSNFVGVYLQDVDKLGRFESKRAAAKFLRQNGYVQRRGYDWYHVKDGMVEGGGDSAISEGYIRIGSSFAEAIHPDGREEFIAYGGDYYVYQQLQTYWSGWDWIRMTVN